MSDYDNPKLYALAKQITLRFGIPWTDPRTGKTYYPGEKKGRKREKRTRS